MKQHQGKNHPQNIRSKVIQFERAVGKEQLINFYKKAERYRDDSDF